MRNTTLSNKPLSNKPLVTALVAGVFALAATASAHAQVLGHGSLAGGLAGGLGGQLRSTMGPMDGRIGGSMGGTGMGDIGIDPRAAERRAELLRKRAAATAASATGTPAHIATQLDDQAATRAAAGLAGATGAGAGKPATLDGTAELASSAAGAADVSGARRTLTDTAGQAAGQARSAVSTANRDDHVVLAGAREGAGTASAAAKGSAESVADTGLGVVHHTDQGGAQPTGAVGAVGADPVDDASGTASTGPRNANTPSNDQAASKPGALPKLSGVTRHAGDIPVDVSGAGNGDANVQAASGGSTRPASARGHAAAQASAQGSTRDGLSTSARAGGEGSASVNARGH